MFKIGLALAMFSVAVISGLANAAETKMGGMDMTGGKTLSNKSSANKSSANKSPADKALAQSMSKMMKNMKVKSSGDTDRDFTLMMIPHHEGAIDMAKVELQYGKDPMLLKLAADIVVAQEKEIADMKDWLAKNGK